MELKNGETYNGNLVSVDQYMNLQLSDVVCTSKDGERFWKLAEALVRGPAIKYLRIPEDVLDRVPAADAGLADSGAFAGGGRGGGCVRGRMVAHDGGKTRFLLFSLLLFPNLHYSFSAGAAAVARVAVVGEVATVEVDAAEALAAAVEGVEAAASAPAAEGQAAGEAACGGNSARPASVSSRWMTPGYCLCNVRTWRVKVRRIFENTRQIMDERLGERVCTSVRKGGGGSW